MPEPSDAGQGAGHILRRWVDTPEAFFAAVWPGCSYWEKQREILLSVRDNYSTVVHSCVESGKDWIAARLVLWFFSTRHPCRVICTSSSVGQLRRVLWGEIDRAFRDTAIPLGIDKKHMMLRRLDPAGRPYANDWVQLVSVAAVENLMGTHLASDDDTPRILAVLDEASAVSDELAELIESQAHRILVIGNPLRMSGRYANMIRGGDVVDEFRPGRFRRRVIHIDVRKTPNVAAGIAWDKEGRQGPCPRPFPGLMSYPDYVHHLREWPEFRITTCLYGQLLEDDASQLLVPRRWLEYGQTAWGEVDRDHRATLPKYMGVDAAMGGGDLACWIVVDQLGVCDIRTLAAAGFADEEGIPQTGKQLDITRQMQAKWDIPWENIAVDAGGSGKPAIVDPLRKEGKRVAAVEFGGGASKRHKKEYVNRRAELYGELAKQIDPGLERETDGDEDSPLVPRKWLSVETESGRRRWERAFTLPPHGRLRADVEALVDELSLIPRLHDGEGKMFLPPKDRKAGQKTGQCLREMLGRSPDRSDACALAVWRMRTRQRAFRRLQAYEPVDPNFDVRKTKAWKRIMG